LEEKKESGSGLRRIGLGVGNFGGYYGEVFQVGEAEGSGDGYVGGIAAGGHEDAADARDIVAGIEGPPAVVEIGFEPSAEIHGVRTGRNAYITEVAGDIARGNV